VEGSDLCLPQWETAVMLCMYKVGLGPSNGDINRLIMTMMMMKIDSVALGPRGGLFRSPK
jgi:hypothetical protein